MEKKHIMFKCKPICTFLERKKITCKQISFFKEYLEINFTFFLINFKTKKIKLLFFIILKISLCNKYLFRM